MLLCEFNLAEFEDSKVKRYSRIVDGKVQQVAQHVRKREKKSGIGKKLAIGAIGVVGAGALGIPAAMLLSKPNIRSNVRSAIRSGMKKRMIRKKYSDNLTNYATKLSRNFNSPNFIKNTPIIKEKTLNIIIGGATDDASYVKRLKKVTNKYVNSTDKTEYLIPGKYLTKETISSDGDIYINPLDAKSFVLDYMKETDVKPELKEIINKVTKHSLKQPDLKINVIGHSYGGALANDLMTVLDRSGIKHNVKAVTLGTPNLGKTFINKKVKNIISNKDNSIAYLARHRNVKLMRAKELKGVRYPKFKNINTLDKLKQYGDKYKNIWLGQGHDIKHYWENFDNQIKSGLHS